MPVLWKAIDLPLGAGMDGNTAPTALPPGRAKALTNLQFSKAGGLTKRLGFDTKLGGAIGANAVLNVSNQRLLGVAGGVLYDYSPAGNGNWTSRGNYRAVPTTSQVVKNQAGDIPVCDAFSAGGYTVLVWAADQYTLSIQIQDEATGSVLGIKSYTMGAVINRIQAIGNAGVNFADFYIVVANTIVRGHVVSGSGGVTWDSAPTTFATGTFAVGRAVINGAYVSCAAIGVSGVGFANADLNTLALTQTSVSAFSVASNSPIAVLLNGGTLNVAFHTGSNWGFLPIPTGTGVPGVYVTLSNTANVPSNACFSPMLAGQSVLYYDDSTVVGSAASLVYKCVAISGSGPGAPAVFMRSVSLATDMATTGNKFYVGVVYYSKVTSTLAAGTLAAMNASTNAQTVKNAAAALASLATINSCFLVVDGLGNIISRVFRQSALTMANTSSASVTSAGNIVLCARVLSAAESGTLTAALALGAAAVVRVNASSERARGVTAFRDFVTVGGSPTCYDGTAPTELGFHVYPEMLKAVAADLNGGFSPTVIARSTNYKVGDVLSYAGVFNPAPNTNVGQLYVCTVAGKTAASGSAPTPSALTVDGTASFRAVGFFSPRPFGVQGTLVTGSTVLPTTPNGYIYVATNLQSSGGAPGTEPAWPTTLGATVISNGGGSTGIQFTCAGTFNAAGPSIMPSSATTNLGYTYQLCWSYVDDQGQLHRSAASVPAGVTLSPPNYAYASLCLLVIPTLRLSAKSSVRAEVYRTAGNGTVCQLIALLNNDPTVDAMAIVDSVPDSTQATGAVLYQGPLGAGGLPNSPPPSCSTVASFGQRIATNNLENPLSLNISQLIVDGYGIAFADALSIQFNGAFGNINALLAMDDKLVIFQDRAISYIQGDGPDNTGGGVGFGSILPVATDVGCSLPESVVLCPLGILFQSSRGIYLLSRGLQTLYVGEDVQSNLTASVIAAINDPAFHHVLFLVSSGSTANAYCYDYESRSWGVWDIKSAAGTTNGMAAWNGTLVCVDTSGNVYKQSGTGYTDPDGSTVKLTADLAPVRLDGLLGYGRVRGVNLQFFSSSTPTFTLGIKENDAEAVTYTLPAQALAAGHDSFDARFENQKLESAGLLITETVSGGAVTIEGITFTVGIEGGRFRRPAGKQVG